jgi:ligand-binding sensor domain-containing protein
MTNGVGYFDGETFANFTEKDGLVSNAIICIEPDSQGNIWFGGHGVICRYDGRSFHQLDTSIWGDRCFGEEQGLPASTWAVAQTTTGGPLWVGGMGALGRFDSHTYEPIDVEINGYVRRIQSDHQGRIWACTNRDGVLCYKGTQCQPFTYQDGLPYPFADAVQVDRKGQIWFATWGG